MSIFQMISSGWRRFVAPFTTNHSPTLLDDVSDAYRTELDLVARCIQHAQRVHYLQFRVELLRIATEVQAHLPWLQEQLLALGGHIPASPASPPTPEGNSWECFRRDVEEVRRSCGHLLEWIHRAERETPAIAAGFQRIRTDKLRHREEFREMLMKSDPYTNSPMGPPQAHEARQKQAWLEQSKGEWLDHGRAVWKDEGKQTPWAEWSGEQESKWTAELPRHDREWRQHLAEKTEPPLP